MGGAQAIAALAYGTESVEAVDVIAGPGTRGSRRPSARSPGRGRHRRHRRAERAGGDRRRRAPTPSWSRSTCSPRPSTATTACCGCISPDERAARCRRSARSSGWRRERPSVRDAELAGDRHGRRARRGATWPRRSRPSTSSSSAASRGARGAVRRAGCLFVGAGAGTAFGDYVAGLQPRAAHRRRRALPVGALGGHLPAPHGSRILARRGARPASRPPAQRWPAPRASPCTPNRWSAAREQNARRSHRTTDETDISSTSTSTARARARAPPASGSSTTCSTRVARHGGLDLDVHARGRPRDRPAPHRRGHRPAARARRSTRRSATAPASAASATPWCRWTRRAPAARSTSRAGPSACSRPTSRPSASPTSTPTSPRSSSAPSP